MPSLAINADKRTKNTLFSEVNRSKRMHGQCIDVNMKGSYEAMSLNIQALLEKSHSSQILIAIAGPPGAGKSTTAIALASLVPNSIQLPMDGYHYYRKELDKFDDPVEAYRRRGAHWTFNATRFVHDIKHLKEELCGTFPSFDHAVGDPIENDIIVTTEHKVVIIEGNYLLLDIAPWNELEDLFDYSYFISCDLPVVEQRVFRRHIAVGCNEEEALHRVRCNDSLNAQYILESASRANEIITSL